MFKSYLELNINRERQSIRKFTLQFTREGYLIKGYTTKTRTAEELALKDKMRRGRGKS